MDARLAQHPRNESTEGRRRKRSVRRRVCKEEELMREVERCTGRDESLDSRNRTQGRVRHKSMNGDGRAQMPDPISLAELGGQKSGCGLVDDDVSRVNPERCEFRGSPA